MLKTPEDFQDLIRYFAGARDGYKRKGDLEAAQACENAIATAYRIQNERGIKAHYSNQRTTPKPKGWCSQHHPAPKS